MKCFTSSQPQSLALSPGKCTLKNEYDSKTSPCSSHYEQVKEEKIGQSSLRRQHGKIMVAYAVEISETDMNVRMEMEHGTRLSTLKVNAELAGVDLSGSKIESYRRIWISESAGSDRSRRCSPFSHFVSWTRNSLRPVKETCSHHLQQAAIHSHRLR